MATKSDTHKTSSNDDGSMTVKEAGERGGKATSETHDKKFYQQIGSEGGSKSGGNFKNDPERAAEAGSHSHDNDGKKSESSRS